MPTKTGVWVLVKQPGNQERASGVFLTFFLTVSEKVTFPFCSADFAKLGQSPTVFGYALRFLASLLSCLRYFDRRAPEQRYCGFTPFDRSHAAGFSTRLFAKSRGKWLNLWEADR